MTITPLASRLRLARLALWWEKAAPAITAALSLLALTTTLALLDVAVLLPGWMHGALLAVLTLAFALMAGHLRRLPRPSDSETARRLEQDSGISHRPLAALEDSMAAGDPQLWEAHRQRMEKLAQGLTPGWPRPVMAKHDPFGLRFAALLLLVIAAAGGSTDWRDRFGRFLNPALNLPNLGPSTLDVWVTPPPYTGLAVMMLRPGTSSSLSIPRDSMVNAVIIGGFGSATLMLGEDATPLLRDETKAQRGNAKITSGSSVAIKQGWLTIASWPVMVVPDSPPVIALTGQPESDDRGRLQVKVEASDDYGLVKAWLEIQPQAPLSAEQITIPLTLPGNKPRHAAFPSRLDLAAHDWAGQAVRLIPHAEDGAAQISHGETMTTTLPERIFRHPVARALILWRKEFSDAPRLGPDVAERIRQLLADPDVFGGDERVFLTLALARRLLSAEQVERTEIRDLMWNAATRLDDGGLPAAEHDLEQARRDLEQAITSHASPQRLAELLDHFEAAMERYLAALAETGQHTPPSSGPPLSGPPLSGPPSSGAMAEDKLSGVLDSLRDLAATGDHDTLRKRLAELSDALSQLGRSHPASPGDEHAARTMSKLREISRMQQDLLDQSFRKSPPSSPEESEDDPPPRPSKPTAADRAEAKRAATAQSALKDALNQLSKALGKAPPSLDDAARSMAGSAESLGKGDWPSAAEQQSDALRMLKDGARELADAMEAAQGQGKGTSIVRDPFGRTTQGSTHRDDGATKVPGQSEARRAREILDELRRRSGDPTRPQLELDYLRRLLKQF